VLREVKLTTGRDEIGYRAISNSEIKEDGGKRRPLVIHVPCSCHSQTKTKIREK
jgi:hypothetical protein